MNIIFGLFLLCNWKKFLKKDLPSLPQNITESAPLWEKPVPDYYWGDDLTEILDVENQTFLDNKNRKKGYSMDVKSNIYLFIDI